MSDVQVPKAERDGEAAAKPATRPAEAGRYAFLGSPLLLSLVGIVGTGVGALSQGYWNTVLEQQKFEYTLIQKALDTSDRAEAQKSLRFLVDVGLVKSLKSENIRNIDPAQIPLFYGAAVRDKLISIKDAKEVLAHTGQYSGPIDDNADEVFRKAIASFQMANSLPPDGLIGAITYSKLVSAWPDHFKLPK